MSINLKDLSRHDLYLLRVEVQNEIDRYEEAAKAALMLGIPVEGYTLKKGRKSRKIKDEKGLVDKLTQEGIPFGDLYQTKLKGIPALEKIAKGGEPRDILNEHIEVTTGDPTLQYVGDTPDEAND